MVLCSKAVRNRLGTLVGKPVHYDNHGGKEVGRITRVGLRGRWLIAWAIVDSVPLSGYGASWEITQARVMDLNAHVWQVNEFDGFIGIALVKKSACISRCREVYRKSCPWLRAVKMTVNKKVSQ